MCLQCGGMSDEEVRRRYLEMIERHGWAICGVEAGGGVRPFAYTIGLTRFHDHPELLISGLELPDAQEILNRLGEQVRRGHRYTGGEVVPDVGRHRFMMVRVSDPDELVYAQDVYGAEGATPIQALQVVWSDHQGRWPWERRWSGGRAAQDLYCRRPPRAA